MGHEPTTLRLRVSCSTDWELFSCLQSHNMSTGLHCHVSHVGTELCKLDRRIWIWFDLFPIGCSFSLLIFTVHSCQKMSCFAVYIYWIYWSYRLCLGGTCSNNLFVEPLSNAKKLATDLFVEPLTNVRELVHLQVGKLSHKASPTSPILAYIHHSETESKHWNALQKKFSFFVNFFGVNIAKEEKGVMHS